MSKRSARPTPQEGVEDLLRKQFTTFQSWHVREPALLVGDSERAADPKTGIAAHGPFRSTGDSALAQIRVGIIGTGETIQNAQRWLDRCRRHIHPQADAEADPYLFPSFPGFETPQGFGCALEVPPHLVQQLSPVDVARCTRAQDRDAAVEAMVSAIRERLDALKDNERTPDVVLIALPREVRAAAGGGRIRKRSTKRQRESASNRQPQLAFMDPRPCEPFSLSRTLHRAIKAEGMRVGLPTQLVWNSTLLGEGVQDDATRAWNFCTALYYKSNGVPWRVTGLGKNTCYVGISFYRPIGDDGRLQTSMAQAFSDRGDGMVLRGASFPWDPKTRGAPHLSRAAANQLLSNVIEQYRKHHAQLPARVVVHKSSWFSEEELRGMEDALDGQVPHHDFVSLSASSIRFLRTGAEPPIRGTVIEVAPRRYVAYTRGYVPFLKLYPGLRIPHPLELAHPVGGTAVTELMTELLALTRMNWNSADFASAEPITLGFSRAVGLILSELPDDVAPQRSFRFYM